MQYVTLNNGVQMPILGYGVYQVTKDECERCVLDALKVGYRSIDTAQSYFNEDEVGNALVKSGIPREEIFLTTKVWIEHYGYDECRASVLESLRKLKTDYVDLCLLHQPFSDVYGAYRALEDLMAEGKIRAIGISNFYVDRMVDIASFARVKPAVNQIEIHPHHQQNEQLEWHNKYGIQLEAWAPFGEGRGGMFDLPELKAIGEAERVAGENRYRTSVKVADRFLEAPEAAVLAYARNFPDGLCGGPLAYALGAPLILTDNYDPSEADTYVRGISAGIVTGGTGLIPDAAVRAIFDLPSDAQITDK